MSTTTCPCGEKEVWHSSEFARPESDAILASLLWRAMQVHGAKNAYLREILRHCDIADGHGYLPGGVVGVFPFV